MPVEATVREDRLPLEARAAIASLPEPLRLTAKLAQSDRVMVADFEAIYRREVGAAALRLQEDAWQAPAEDCPGEWVDVDPGAFARAVGVSRSTLFKYLRAVQRGEAP